MKKLIAISVVFTLMVCAVYAQPSVGGNLKMSASLLSGESANPVDKTYPQAGKVTIWDSHVNVNFGNADGGGMMRLWSIGSGGSNIDWTPDIFTFWWYKPIPQLRIQVGKNADGDFGHGQIVGWGFNAEAQGGIAVDEYRGIGSGSLTGVSGNGAFGPGFGGLGVAITAQFVEGLTINLAIPMDTKKTWADIYGRTFLDVKYDIPDIGTAKLAVQFVPFNKEREVQAQKDADNGEFFDAGWKGSGELRDSAQVWLGFYLNAIDGMGAELGLGYKFPIGADGYKEELRTIDGKKVSVATGGIGAGGLPANAKRIHPTKLGLGFRFGSGDFNIKVRAGANFGGGEYLVDPKVNQGWYETLKKRGDNPSLSQFFLTSDPTYTLDSKGKLKEVPKGWQTTKKDDFIWGINILPSYKIGNLSILFNAGIGATHYAKQTIYFLNNDDPADVKNEKVEVQGIIVSEKSIISSVKELELMDATGKGLITKNAAVDWYINPYIKLPAGSGTFYAGFKLYTDGTRIPVKYEFNKAIKDAGLKAGEAAELKGFGALNSKQYQVKWEIPIGLNFYF